MSQAISTRCRGDEILIGFSECDRYRLMALDRFASDSARHASRESPHSPQGRVG
ncbi:MAG: hypothetical protein AB4040_05595 [Synechococcus sp.]